MALQEEFEKTGEYFFRWRSYLPLIMAIFFIPALVVYRTSFQNHGLNLAWDFFCLAVALLGEGLRFFTVGFVPRGTSGRNTLGQVADTLNTTGMYAVVRNPLYLGNFIIWFGLSLFMKLWWFTALIVLFFLVFYERIIFAEERFLREKFGDEFLQWAARTPVIMPNFKDWRPPALPFSWKSALVREYGSFYAIIATFTFLELLAGLCSYGKLTIEAIWIKIFLGSTIFYLIIRYLKKKTKVLATDNR
ncbi:MAG: isoprenylcysteine carboxylmethyltransferase family protein [Desulfobaccales bacterium]